MNTKQKTLLGIFLGMFVVPEIIFGPIIKILKLSYLPLYQNSQTFSDNPIYAYLIILIEIIGCIGLLYTISKINLKKITRYFFNILLGLITLVLLFALLISYVMAHISFF